MFRRSPCQEIISADHEHSKCCWDAHCCLWIRKFMMWSLSSVQLPPQNLKTLPKRSSKWRMFLERVHPDFIIFNYFHVKTSYLYCWWIIIITFPKYFFVIDPSRTALVKFFWFSEFLRFWTQLISVIIFLPLMQSFFLLFVKFS